MTQKRVMTEWEKDVDADRKVSMDYIPDKDLVLTPDPILNFVLWNEWRQRNGRKILDN